MTREARLMSGIILITIPTIQYGGYFLLTSLMSKTSGHMENPLRQNFFRAGHAHAGDEYEQAKLSFAKIRNLVEAAGGTMADVMKITIFVTDITQREKVWRARREVFTGDFPASTLVQVAGLAEPSVKVEIEAIAHIGAGKR
jgi:enamine deaminase RidA (YjgF/YER057c/UK114 family)